MYHFRILGTDVSVPTEETNDEVTASVKQKIEEVNWPSLGILMKFFCIHDLIFCRRYTSCMTVVSILCCFLTSLKYLNLILISLKIYKKENQKHKVPIDAPILPTPSINLGWAIKKTLMKGNTQIAKQVGTQDYIDYCEVRWLAPHRS